MRKKYKEYNYEKNKKILGAQQRLTTDKDWPILTILGRDQKIHFISSLIRPHLDILQNNGDDIMIIAIYWRLVDNIEMTENIKTLHMVCLSSASAWSISPAGSRGQIILFVFESL